MLQQLDDLEGSKKKGKVFIITFMLATVAMRVAGRHTETTNL